MSTFIKDFIEKATIDRRRFLLSAAAGVGGAMAGSVLGSRPGAGQRPADHRVELPRPLQPLLELHRLGRRKLRREPGAQQERADQPDQQRQLGEIAGGCALAADANRRQAGAGDRPQRRPQRAPDRGSLRRGGRPCLDHLEQAGGPASLGFRRQLRVAHELVGRRPGRADGENPDQGDGRQGRHRRRSAASSRTSRRSSGRPA